MIPACLYMPPVVSLALLTAPLEYDLPDVTDAPHPDDDDDEGGEQ